MIRMGIRVVRAPLDICAAVVSDARGAFIAFITPQAIWYQGESNNGQDQLYACRYQQMMEEWRREWHGAFVP